MCLGSTQLLLIHTKVLPFLDLLPPNPPDHLNLSPLHKGKKPTQKTLALYVGRDKKREGNVVDQ